ncbi:MAG: ROK family protein [Myxococcota bacterium]
MNTLAIDIGGTGLKMVVLDSAGVPVSTATRADTPQPATPDALLAALERMAADHRDFDRISCGFPGVVTEGHTRNAPNLGAGWADFALAGALGTRFGKPARVANDADVQGFGAIEGRGVELTVTLGTGVGSGLFTDGRLVPNLELGHAPFRDGASFEQLLGKPALDKRGRDAWHGALFEALAIWHALFNPRLLHLGGGHAQIIERPLPPRTRVVDNSAGLIGGVALWRNPEG